MTGTQIKNEAIQLIAMTILTALSVRRMRYRIGYLMDKYLKKIKNGMIMKESLRRYLVEGDQKAPFQFASTRGALVGATPITDFHSLP